MPVSEAFTSFIAFFAFASTGLVSAVATFVALFILARPKLSFVAGIAAGLLFVHYFWQSATLDEDYQPIRRLLEIAAIAGSVLPPWLVVQRMTGWDIPEYPNEKWTSPASRAKAAHAKTEQEEKAEQTSASWREQNDDRKPTGRSDPRWNRFFRQANARMPVEEAWEVLGLESGASLDEVRDAHHRLITRLHPDAGGNNWLAGKVNEARDALLEGQ